jgi:hypothetical protein
MKLIGHAAVTLLAIASLAVGGCGIKSEVVSTAAHDPALAAVLTGPVPPMSPRSRIASSVFSPPPALAVGSPPTPLANPQLEAAAPR